MEDVARLPYCAAVPPPSGRAPPAARGPRAPPTGPVLFSMTVRAEHDGPASRAPIEVRDDAGACAPPDDAGACYALVRALWAREGWRYDEDLVRRVTAAVRARQHDALASPGRRHWSRWLWPLCQQGL